MRPIARHANARLDRLRAARPTQWREGFKRAD